MAAAHSHSLYGRTWSSLGRKLDPITQDACAFFEHHGLFDEWAFGENYLNSDLLIHAHVRRVFPEGDVVQG